MPTEPQHTTIKERPRIIRILSIDQQIRDEKFPNARTLARDLRVTDRSIHRDIDYMRMEYDAPIAYNAKRNGFYYENPEWKFLLSTTLDREQVQALILARQLFSAYEGSPLFDKASRAIELMHQNGLPLDREESVYSFEQPEPRHFFPFVFAQIEDAIRYRITANIISLESYSSGIVENPFDPYLLHYSRSRDAWYFLGLSHTAKRIKVVGLHRIKMVKLTEKHFDIPEEFSAAPYLETAFEDTRRERLYIVRIHFSSRAANILMNFPMIHRHQQMDVLTDGSTFIFVATDDLQPIKDWLLKFGPFFKKGMRILSPDELLKMVPTRMRDQGPSPEGLASDETLQ